MFGDADFNKESGGGYKKNHKIVDGDNIFRVLPPFGSLQQEAKGWFKYHRVHWGAKILTDDGKQIPKPFLCIEEMDWKTRTVRQSCPACDRLQKNKEQMAVVEGRAREEGRSEEEVKALLKPYNDYRNDHNADGKYYVNAMSTDGVVSLLPLNKTYKEKLETLGKEYQAKGYSIMSLDRGFWINFKRSPGARKSDPNHDVFLQKVVRILDDGAEAEILAPSSLTAEQVEACKAGATDLKLSPPAAKLTFDQIDRIVRSEWDMEVVTSIFNSPIREESAGRYSNGARKNAPVERSPAYQPAKAPPAAPETIAAPSAPAAQTPNVSALQAQLAALQAELAAATQAAAVTQTPLAAPAPAPAVSVPMAEVATPAPAAAPAFAAEASPPPKSDLTQIGSMTPAQFREYMKSRNK